MDKIEKIRQKIDRMLDDICDVDGFVQKKDEPRYDALVEVLSFIDTLSEGPASKGYDEAYLNEKIAKASKTWEGVDVDKYMDEIRGREPDKSLEETAADFVWDTMENDYYGPSELSKRLRPTSKLDDFYGALAEIFIAGAKWQAGQLLKGSPLPEDTVLFQKGVEEGKRLMLEGAVEGFVAAHLTSEGTKITVNSGYLPKEMCIKPGEKVRIIVCKKKD